MPTSDRRPFNLTRWFSVLSLVCITSISAISAFLLSNFLTDTMLHRDAVVSMEFVQAVVLADRAATYFLAGQSGGSRRDLEDTFKHFAQMPDVLRANVYARDRSVAWSSDKKLIGKTFGANDELDDALAAKLVVNSGVVSKEEHVEAEHPFSEQGVKNFIEIYVPLWDFEYKNVIGVVELYSTPEALFQAIHGGQRLIWASAALGGLFLYTALFWIVRRADGIMREQQQRLIESETLAVVGEMASAVAHGIRNPLSSIRSSVELALDGGSGHLRDCSHDVIAEVDRMEKWVHELLNYSRPVSGGGEIVDLNPIIRRSLDNFAREIGKRSVTISTQLAESLPTVRGHLSMLGQVFNSLIANALDAMSERRQLTVASRLTDDRRHVEVSINDTGTGIAAPELSKVLKPFYTTKTKGIGLGLAQRIVERYGGTLAIASTAGAGTTVTLQLVAAV